MVGIGQGVRCFNEKNQWRVLREGTRKLKRPLIPALRHKCELFEFDEDRPPTTEA